MIDFAPTTTAAVTGTASIADNGLNTTQVQTVQLSAGAGETAATTTTINVTTPVFGQTQVGATILATAGTLVPVGSVVFTVDGAVQPTVTVNGSGVVTLPSAVANALAVGSHTIAAVYTSSSLGFSNSNATRIFSVTQVPPTITFAPSTTSLSVPRALCNRYTYRYLHGRILGSTQFSCTGLPQNATCSFQPATVTVSGTSGPQTTVVTIQTAGSTAALRRDKAVSVREQSRATCGCILGSGTANDGTCRQKAEALFASLPLGRPAELVRWDVATERCGGGSPRPNRLRQVTPSAPVTPAGTSTVTDRAANSGSTVQSFNLTLTVQ